MTGRRNSSYGPAEFARDLDVSRETLDGLKRYQSLLTTWQQRINLVSTASLDDLWRRHFLDSAQLAGLALPTVRKWVDIGSGAGFPGLVAALLLRDRPAVEFHLVESDQRKCAFLRTVIRALALPAFVHPHRIESLPPMGADVITARALAPVGRLLTLAVPHRAENGTFLFLKGQDVEKELTEASKSWIIREDRLQSRSDPSGIILRIKEAYRGAT